MWPYLVNLHNFANYSTRSDGVGLWNISVYTVSKKFYRDFTKLGMKLHWVNTLDGIAFGLILKKNKMAAIAVFYFIMPIDFLLKSSDIPKASLPFFNHCTFLLDTSCVGITALSPVSECSCLLCGFAMSCQPMRSHNLKVVTHI